MKCSLHALILITSYQKFARPFINTKTEGLSDQLNIFTGAECFQDDSDLLKST